MCTYNGERFLAQQLDSIINQTYTNIEIVICDDGSTDKTIQMIQEYQKKFASIKLYQNKTNLGFVQNFAKAISLTTGDYVATSDQDDIWLENKLEVFVKEIKDNVLIYSDAVLIDSQNKKQNKYLNYPKRYLVSGENCSSMFLFHNCISGNTMMFESGLKKHILPIPKGVEFHDKYIAFVASCVGSISYTKENYVYYRRHDRQVTADEKKKFYFFKRIEYKKNKLIKQARQKLTQLEILRKSSFIDTQTKYLLDCLIEHYRYYDKGFINFKIVKLILIDRVNIFGMLSQTNKTRSIFKLCIKLNFYRLFGYII